MSATGSPWRWASSSCRSRGGALRGLLRRLGRRGRLGLGALAGEVGADVRRDLAGALEAVGRDAGANPLGAVGGQRLHGDVGGLGDAVHGQAGDVGLDPPEDGHLLVGDGDVVLVLGPAVGQRGGADEDGEQDPERDEPAQPLEPARRTGGVAQRLRVHLGAGRRVAGHRLHLAGVPAAVAAEEALGRQRLLAGLLGGRADQHRAGAGRRPRVRLGGGLLVHDVGDHGRHVVAAAGVERGPDQLHGGVVDRAGAEDVGDPVVVEHPGAAVAAEQDAVPGREVDVEQVRVGLVHAVHRPEDQVAVRVGAGLLLGDPALVDEALDEGVVLGESGQRALAQQVAPAVADVADGDLGAVEECGGDRRTGAVELGVLVDELREPVVGAVDRARHRFGHVLRRRRVEAAQDLHRRAARDVAPRGPAHPVGDHQQVGTGEAGVLVVLPHAADVGQGGVAEAQRSRVHAAGATS